MMCRLNRYLGRHILGAIIMVLLIIVLLDAVFSFIAQLSDLRANYAAMNALWYILLRIPESLYSYLPFAVLVGCLIGLGHLASSNELTAIRAAGVSLSRLVFWIFGPGLIMMLLGIFLSECVIPVTGPTAEHYRTLHRLQAGRFSNEGIWYRQGHSFIYMGAIDAHNGIHDISQFTFDHNNRLTEVTKSQSAQYKDGIWTLEAIRSTHLTAEKTQVHTHQKQVWQEGPTPKNLRALTVKPELLSISGLITYAKYLKTQELNADTTILSLWNKIFQPLALLSLMLVGIAFVLGPLRSVTVGLRVFAGVLIGLVFMVLQRLMGPMSLIYGIPPFWAVLLPISFCFIGGIFLLKRST